MHRKPFPALAPEHMSRTTKTDMRSFAASIQKIGLLTAALSCLTASYADYSGPAKSCVQQFWKSIDRIGALPDNRSRAQLAKNELRAAENSLRHARARDPALDTAAMESALTSAQQGAASDGCAASATRESAENATRYLSRFGEALTTGRARGNNQDIAANAEQAVQAFESAHDAFEATPPDAKTVANCETRNAARQAGGITARHHARPVC